MYKPLTEQEKRDIVKRDHEAYEQKTRSQNVGMDSAATASRKAACETITKLALEIQQEKRAAVAVDHRADDDALTNLIRMKPAQRATAFEREARGERVGVNDKLVELRERLDIPEGQEEQNRETIRQRWANLHRNNSLKL